ncbi:membrane protein [Thermosipho sp. 1063]|nr:membrane protein [Thermosipho sp. 1070]APT72964.1 membrane protein [Thermosipho sp. 1063]
MEFTINELITLFSLIFLAGFVDSISGGGGLISLPAYLFLGLPSHNALATNKLSSSIGTTLSTLRYAKGKFIVFEVALFSVIFSFAGSFIGANLALLVSENKLKIVISVLVVMAAFLLLFRTNDKAKKLRQGVNLSRIKKILISSLIGFLVGMYDGFFGPGTGTFLVILYINFLFFEPVKASGTSKIVNLASNISALITFILEHKVVYSIGLPAAFFGILGNWLGSGLAIKKGERIIRPVIIIVLFLLFIKILKDII